MEEEMDRAQAVRDADEAARQAFHSALCDGGSYAQAIAKGAAVYREAMAPLFKLAGLA
jgi:hypothetical protein